MIAAVRSGEREGRRERGRERERVMKGEGNKLLSEWKGRNK